MEIETTTTATAAEQTPAETTPTPPAETQTTETATTQAASPEATANDAKPYLGAPKNEKPAETTPTETNQTAAPEPPTEQAYMDAVKKSDTIPGDFSFDEKLIKSVIPTFQKHGLSPEAANEAANAFAKAQLDSAREALKERSDYFAKMNNAARAKYSENDFVQINAGIDNWFKPGGIMNNVIRNSELGADPEFLALMHHLGATVREDSGKGAADAGGDGGGDPNGIGGISKLW